MEVTPRRGWSIVRGRVVMSDGRTGRYPDS